MGVGKTRVCQVLKNTLQRSVFLDGDWCWDAHPFQVTPETCAMVQENIVFLLNQFIHCSAYDHIIFCWVMHQQAIIDTLLAGLDTSHCEVKLVSLVCEEDTLRERLQMDVDAGIREADILRRSPARLPLYAALRTIHVDTTGKTPEEIAEFLQQL